MIRQESKNVAIAKVLFIILTCWTCSQQLYVHDLASVEHKLTTCLLPNASEKLWSSFFIEFFHGGGKANGNKLVVENSLHATTKAQPAIYTQPAFYQQQKILENYYCLIRAYMSNSPGKGNTYHSKMPKTWTNSTSLCPPMELMGWLCW